MRYFDTIIVGQGLAGTALAWQFTLTRRRNFLIIDREPPVTASRIAAGLVTPITGQRLVKTEHFEERFAEAEAFYRPIEAELQCSFFHRRPMLRLFQNERERQIFESKRDSEFAGLVEEHPAVDTAPLGGFAMTTAGQLDTREYLDRSREWFAARDQYLNLDFDPVAELALPEGCRDVHLHRRDIRAHRVIFCQGFLNTPNPYFTGIPFQAAQGDILTLRIPGFRERRVIHAMGIWLAPVDTQGDAVPPLYRCGSTYSWEPFDGQPSSAGRAELERKLQSFLKLPYEVVDHRAAVRPIIRESRPRLGMHPYHPYLGFFNGLGSKGSLLAPHFARKFVEHIYDGVPLEPETSVRSFLLKPPTERAHDLLRGYLLGHVVIDATAGNGHDTRYLAERVGPTGKVFAFDIQKAALERTAEVCREFNNVTLIERSHAEMKDAIPVEYHGTINAVMFNLGYRPGGDKSIVTQPESSVAAIRAASELIGPGGWLSIILYVGHPGGAEEATAVEAALRGLPFLWMCETSGAPNAPRLWLGRRKSPSPDDRP